MKNNRLLIYALAVLTVTAAAAAADADTHRYALDIPLNTGSASSHVPAASAPVAAPTAVPGSQAEAAVPTKAEILKLKKSLPVARFQARVPYTYAGSRGSALETVDGNAEKLVYNSHGGDDILWPVGKGYIRYESNQDFMPPSGIYCELIGNWADQPQRDSLLDGFVGIMTCGDDGAVYSFRGWDWTTVQEPTSK